VARYLPFLLSLALTIYALFSCVQTRDEDVPYLPKLVWVVLIVLLPFVGPITWLLMSWSYRQRAGGQPGGASPAGPPPSSRPPRASAPDDDPEFLAWLARQQRRKSPPPPKPDAGRPQDATGADGNDDSGDPKQDEDR
jgi:Phospholipase_D-nuclease N-terminal